MGEGQPVMISPKAIDPELRYKFWQLVALYANLVVAIGGFYLLISSVHSNTKSVSANWQNGVLTHVTSLDRLFIEKPFLYPYFYEGKEPDPNDPHYQEIMVAAEWFTDVLDTIGIQNPSLREAWGDPAAWDNWTADMLKHSPVMRKFLKEHSGWYSKALTDKLKLAQGDPN